MSTDIFDCHSVRVCGVQSVLLASRGWRPGDAAKYTTMHGTAPAAKKDQLQINREVEKHRSICKISS